MKWRVISVLALAMFIIVLDTTVMNVAVPTIVSDLSTDVTSVQTTIALYALVMSMFMITGGKMGDIWGRKVSFRRGLLIYGAGSAVTALSPSIWVLACGWSIMEGIGAALMMPALYTLITTHYHDNDRAAAFGIIGAVVAGGAAFGPIIGGIVITELSWRFVFAGEVAAVIIIFLSLKFIAAPELPEKRPTLDIGGLFLSAAGMALIVLGVLLSGRYGFFEAWRTFSVAGISLNPFGLSPTPVFVAAGAAVLAIFLAWERHRRNNGLSMLVNPKIFGNIPFFASVSIDFLESLILAGMMFIVPLFLQITHKYSPMEAGFTLLPLAITLFIASVSGPLLMRIFNQARIVQLGIICTTLGAMEIAYTLDIQVIGIDFWIGQIFFGCGAGIIVSQIVNLSLSLVSGTESNEASGLINTGENLGSSIGTALVGAILIAGLSGSFIAFTEESQTLDCDLKKEIKSVVLDGIQVASDEEAKTVVAELPPAARDEILDINAKARMWGMSAALWVITALIGISLIFTFFLPGGGITRSRS